MKKKDLEKELKYAKEFANLYLQKYEKVKDKLLKMNSKPNEVDFSILNGGISTIVLHMKASIVGKVES